MLPSTTLLHLNSARCVIRCTQDKGRGVYASHAIPAQSLIEISPVLFFSKEEYATHGKFTVLDDYTFKWSDGRMALALGLGSLFNHSEHPNVSFTLDSSTDSIKYTTARDIAPDEELCIFYGHKLWFQPAGSLYHPQPVSMSSRDEAEDGWSSLSLLLSEEPEHSPSSSKDGRPSLKGDPNEIVADEDLPWTRYKLPPEEEDLDSIRTVEAWAVDIPDTRHIATMLKWLKHSSLDTPDLSHLKRIRKLNDKATLLLATLITSPSPPSLSLELGLLAPYCVSVPSAPALTPMSLKLKSTFWPTLFTPPRKGEMEDWTYGKVRWAWEAMQVVVAAAREARTLGELPIAAHVAAPYISDHGEAVSGPLALTFTACDSRQSNAHPLRHAVMNVIRQVADYHGSKHTPSLVSAAHEPSLSGDEQGLGGGGEEQRRNGTNYLLTSLTVFLTHEPCIMCSMALVHSRVKEVFYLCPMPTTGGCGGAACLPTLKGINHRFSICQWKVGSSIDKSDIHVTYDDLYIDDTTDA